MSEKYNIIKQVIESKRYELADILVKIDTIWLQGDITTEQKDELVTKAREGADVSNSIEVLKKLEEIDKRVRVIEVALASDSESNEDPDAPVAEFVAGKWYYAGNLVTFEGDTYKCIAPEGVVCVWSPKDFPAYWEKVKTE